MYIRVKRQRSTAFLHLSPSDTVAAVKQKLKELYDIDPKNQRLYKDGTVLEDNRSLAELKIETDDVLVVAFQIGVWMLLRCSCPPSLFSIYI